MGLRVGREDDDAGLVQGADSARHRYAVVQAHVDIQEKEIEARPIGREKLLAAAEGAQREGQTEPVEVLSDEHPQAIQLRLLVVANADAQHDRRSFPRDEAREGTILPRRGALAPSALFDRWRLGIFEKTFYLWLDTIIMCGKGEARPEEV